tara:strand:- start:14241 stop:14729 length:489 start_codon:yes stop_codon:yes gene_type:complete
MKNVFFSSLLLLITNSVFGQRSIEKTLEKLNKKSIPYITVEDLSAKINVTILDTRKKEEYDISHLQNAIWVGYKKFNIDSLPIQNKKTNIIVYCSIGVRSEDIGEKLLANGFTNVENLYGGIFKWIEKEYPVFDNNNQSTNRVHIFSKYWGELLTKGEKVLH